jgi:DNA-3-methyladenine glycosylase I
VLESFQAGLSWKTILHKRASFRNAFHQFEIKHVAQMSSKDVEKLMLDKNIVRNKLKIKATINNAQEFIKIQKEYGSFNRFILELVKGKVIHNDFKTMEELPVKTELSAHISRTLKNRGFKFVGSTICYAFMQASGIVNDHTTDCFKHKEINAKMKK